MNPIAVNMLVAVFSALVGGLIGHCLTLVGERRKEYNELADRIYLRVDIAVESHSAHYFHIPQNDIKLIRRRMGFMQRRRFDNALAKYNDAAAQTQVDNSGQPHFCLLYTSDAADE